MRRQRQRLTVLIIILAVIIAGCAKRPQLLQVSAPAPTGAGVTQPPASGSPAPTAPPSAPPPSVAAPPPSVAAPPPSVAAPPPSAPALPAPTQFREVTALKTIHFDFDKSDIRPDAARILDANIDWMKANPEALILIEGHCDERGTNEYNVALGDRRAKASMDYLAAHGVAVARLTTISYGEERPVCAGHTEACWARNRRAHFLTKAR